MMVSNRSYITICYDIEGEDGALIYMASSLGNEAFLKKYEKKIGSDVCAPVRMNYAKYTPCDGGVKIEVVLCIEFGGSIPQMFKDKAAERHANNPITLSTFMMEGKMPPKWG